MCIHGSLFLFLFFHLPILESMDCFNIKFFLHVQIERQTRAYYEDICSGLELKLVEMRGELELMEIERDDHREWLAQVKR